MINANAMKKKNTEVYEAPTTGVVELKVESRILNVSGDAPQYEGPLSF